EQANQLAVTAAPKLSKICDCPADWFVFDYIHSDFFDQSGAIPHFPVLQIWWFKRPQEVQNKVALELDSLLKAMGHTATQISFHIYEESSYYEDGEHY
ncbi:MAG: DUF1904 family protein, partial [Oscillospiraceae bacterium]